MSTTDALQYRALSSAAMVSLVLGLFSSMTIPAALSALDACILMSPIPLIGFFVGIRALGKIREAPSQLTGKPIAWIAIVLNLVFLVGGLGLASYVYATEVPAGYERVTFREMRPDEQEQSQRIGVPEDVLKFDGEKVFIKGYMRPPSQRFGLSEFLLVRDNNQCCFGKNIPDYFDRVHVHLVPPLHADYSTRMFRMAGVLKISPERARPGTSEIVYTLIADRIK